LESCYWAGFLAGDGCISQQGEIKIELHCKDERHLKKFLKFIDADHHLSYRCMKITGGRGIYAGVRFRSDKIKNILICTLNLSSRKSLTINGPKITDKDQKIVYLHGLFDADGHIRIDRHNHLSVQIGTASSTMVEWIQDVFDGELSRCTDPYQLRWQFHAAHTKRSICRKNHGAIYQQYG
jgi:hypothetical protein